MIMKHDSVPAWLSICITLLLLATAVLATAIPATAGGPSTEADGVDEALAWLAMADRKAYGETWDEAAEYFQKAIAPDQWQQAMTGIRSALGNLNSRTLTSATAHSSLPGAPDGNYRVMVFQSSFTGKASAMETVTVVMEKDGVWRVAGYYVR